MTTPTVEWFNRKQNQLLVHSFLYYQLDTSIISDHAFDLWSKQLATAIQDYPEVFAQSHHFRDFKDFDGSSGFDLPFANPDVQARALRLLEYHTRKGYQK